MIFYKIKCKNITGDFLDTLKNCKKEDDSFNYKEDSIFNDNCLSSDYSNSKKSNSVTTVERYCDKFYKANGKEVYFSFVDVRGNNVVLIAIASERCYIEDKIQKLFAFLGLEFDEEKHSELTLEQFVDLVSEGEDKHFLSDKDKIFKLFDIEKIAYDGSFIDYEHIINNRFNKNQLIKLSDNLIQGETLKDEVERIYTPLDTKRVFGHPVHYLIEVDSREKEDKIIEVLLSSLYNNNRLLSKRYRILDFETSAPIKFDEHYRAAGGGTIIIKNFKEGNDSFFDYEDEKDIDKLSKVINKYKNSVLTIFCIECGNREMKKLVLEKSSNIEFIDIKEDLLPYEQSIKFLRSLCHKSKFNISIKELNKLISKDKKYTTKILAGVFDRYISKYLKEEVYKQYSNVDILNRGDNKQSNDPLSELSSLIGLENVKTVVSDIINFYEAQEIFNEFNMDDDKLPKHMVFMGEPGTAKTTVARLFARIMKDKGILSKGDLIEVGRADLIGKYVGWTAPIVKSTFEKAEGSVLFIDEAYSLVDDERGLYGDEAISTIVQEMENRRDDLIVIFAGYTDEMKKFLSVNPGLRNRIGFHIFFDNYTPEELYEIAELIAKKNKRRIDKGAREGLLSIFNLEKQKKDFGNGRFVRNLIDKAKMKQANRLIKLDRDKITKKDIELLIADDFDINNYLKNENRKRKSEFVKIM